MLSRVQMGRRMREIRIRDGHSVAGERNHLAAFANMEVVQRRAKWLISGNGSGGGEGTAGGGGSGKSRPRGKG